MSFKDEKIVESKSCQKCQASFGVTDKDLEFYEKISPVFNGEKFQIPSPNYCPGCRQQRRLSFRNTRQLYKRECDGTGKEMVSIYHPNSKRIVYNTDFWWGDEWDGLEYGVDFDFDRPFFEQFQELDYKVPTIWMLNQNSENSQYCNVAVGCSNSHLCFAANGIEDCLFTTNLSQCEFVVDCYSMFCSKECYECIDVNHSYNCRHSISLENANNSSYCMDCLGIDECIFSIWLHNTSYCILNEKFSKHEYLKIKNDIFTNKNIFEQYFADYQELLTSLPRKSNQIVNSQDCSWDYITDSEDCKHSFDAHHSRSIAYSSFSKINNQDCYDVDAFLNSNLLYESLSCTDSTHKICSQFCWFSHHVLYSDNCKNSQNLFWCIGLRNKSYCIFNKQYTKQEYHILVPKIIEHMKQSWEWWEFFPSSISCFWYNETVAQEYYPLTKDEAIQQWLNWSNYEAPFLKAEKTILANKLPSDIWEIPDDILSWAIECETTQKLFRITAQELEFYRKHNLPIPKRHPEQRYLDRMILRNPCKLFKRDCDRCWVDMQTTYAPDRKEIVYCEKCYEKEVY